MPIITQRNTVEADVAGNPDIVYLCGERDLAEIGNYSNTLEIKFHDIAPDDKYFDDNKAVFNKCWGKVDNLLKLGYVIIMPETMALNVEDTSPKLFRYVTERVHRTIKMHNKQLRDLFRIFGEVK